VLLPWIVWPLALGLLSLGCGLLVEQASGLRLPRALLPPLGLALLVVEGDIATMTDATAGLAAPVAITLAVAGFGLAFDRLRRPGVWAIACACATFAAYAAPVVLSGGATFAGYITLDDTSTWLGITDHVMDHGRTLSDLAPSTYQQVLTDSLGGGYPIGAFMPLGLGGKLTGEDVAWLFQPTVAFYAAMLALAIYVSSTRLVRSAPLRALVGILGAQAALLYAYALWGGIKELVAALLIALVPASVVATFPRWHGARATLPTALAVAALVAVLSPVGAVWLLLPAIVVLVGLGLQGLRRSGRIAVALAGAIALLSIPSIAVARPFIRGVVEGEVTSSTEVANLGHPLDALQVFGIWPATDFRSAPRDRVATYALIAALLAGVVVAVVLARRRRAWGMPLYLATGAGGFLVILALERVGLSSPWLNAKAMAEASPALVAAGVAGAAALFESGRRVEGAVIGAAIAAGVLWSNSVAYSGAWLAPRSQLAELESIASRFAGHSPALMTDVEPYGVRHFLRRLDPEGASDRRRRVIPLLNGAGLAKGEYADLDLFRLDGLLVYRTLVLARSPSESRPSSVFDLVWSGRHYEVWERRDPAPAILAHAPLGDRVQAGGVPACSDVTRLAARAGPAGRLAAPPRTRVVVVVLGDAPLPKGWERDAGGHVFPAEGDGTLLEHFTVPARGRYTLWVGGSFRGRLRLKVDGRLVADTRHRLRPAGYEPLGKIVLDGGRHRLALLYGGADLHPGSGGYQFGLGPLVLSRDATEAPVEYVPAAQARSLCGRNLDWIEALGP
jgi:hypothetical protein